MESLLKQDYDFWVEEGFRIFAEATAAFENGDRELHQKLRQQHRVARRRFQRAAVQLYGGC